MTQTMYTLTVIPEGQQWTKQILSFNVDLR